MNFEMRKTNNSRKGVTLLFTISMIVLFLLMGTTFVVVANDYFKSANRRSRVSSFKVDSTAILERAFYDVLRGPSLNDISSPLRFNSILEDQYGYGFVGRPTGGGAAPASSGALIQIGLDSTELYTIRDNALVNFGTDESYVDNVLGGCVISFTSGVAKGYSTRIVSHTLTGSTINVVFPRDPYGIDWSLVDADDQVLVNGRDFAGTGAGDVALDPETFLDRDTTAISRSDALALQPNRVGELLADSLANYVTLDRSTNEGYDAADFNTMFLSGEDSAGNIIPSFHRDRLYSDRFAALGTPTPADVRRFSFRPVYIAGQANSSANEFFDSGFNTDGSLASADNTEANLDVDSDYDGTKDAVWIDIGLPTQTDSQGRRFRPLVAYYIRDMDGRLNLNAHGSHADAASTVDRLGAGFGVAEVSLDNITSDYTGLLNSRYGSDNVPGNSGNSFSDAGAGPGGTKISQKLFGYPANENPEQRIGGFFTTGGDIFGVTRVMSQLGGGVRDSLPSYVVSSPATLSGNATTSPYDTDFSIGGGAGDSLFDGWELEEILRRNDIDAPLFNGRLNSTGSPLVNADDLDKVTTHSFEVAMPSSPISVVEMLRVRCQQQVDFEVGGTATIAQIRTRLNALIADQILPPEVLMGGKFNLNRTLGNGLDDNGNGAIDEPIESLDLAGASMQERSGQHNTPALDLDNQGDDIVGNQNARQLMAKQLYTLCLLVTSQFDPPATPPVAPVESVPAGLTGVTTDDYKQAVAQWAVNVVDFYDSDSIITAFEYDINPFNDVLVDGNPETGGPSDLINPPETDRGIVYGFERPELLINETFAHHDRQNVDSDADGDDMDGGDDDWDSLRIPQSSSFIELYNPWLHTTPATTPAFSRIQPEFDPAGTGVGVNVAAVSSGGTTPVWRIAVKRGQAAANDYIRMIYFVDPAGAPNIGSEPDVSGISYFPSAPNSAAIEPVAPGEYMVVGSSGNITGTTRNITTFGRRVGVAPTTIDNDPDDPVSSTLTDIETVRGIELINAPGAQRMIYRQPNATTAAQVAVPCKVAIIDSPRSLSLSEPDAGYPAAVNDPTAIDGQILNTLVPQDEPLDSSMDVYRTEADINAIWTNGVQQNFGGVNYVFRTIHLQRLADPTRDWNVDSNPYITIDSAHVNLLGFNGLNNDANNDGMISGAMFPETTAGPIALTAIDGDTEFRTIERGETIADMANEQEARRSFFQTRELDDLKQITTDAPVASAFHNFDFEFLQTLGAANDSHDVDVPFGWLTVNNRPFANAMELSNVPISSQLTTMSLFNQLRTGGAPPVGATAEESFAFYMGKAGFQHTIGFGETVPGGTNNRFDHLLDFVEAPNRFIGSETWLPVPAVGTPIDGSTVTGLTFALNAPFHGLPTFRSPGKVNLNTIYDADIWNAVMGDFNATTYNDIESARNTSSGVTDFGGVFTSANGGEFFGTADGQSNRRGAESLLYRQNGINDLFAAANDSTADGQTDITNSSYFANEVRQRLATSATTRSSVFAIWITVGYFEVDNLGRIGAELGSDEGEVRRNRAFYLVDRSIPVACEPGKNHNVDRAVLVRSIIE